MCVCGQVMVDDCAMCVEAESMLPIIACQPCLYVSVWSGDGRRLCYVCGSREYAAYHSMSTVSICVCVVR